MQREVLLSPNTSSKRPLWKHLIADLPLEILEKPLEADLLSLYSDEAAEALLEADRLAPEWTLAELITAGSDTA